MVRSRRKTARRFLETLSTEVASHDPAIPFSAWVQRKPPFQNRACTLIFRTTLFTMAKTQNPPKRHRKVKTVWYSCTLECHSAMKQNEMMVLAAANNYTKKLCTINTFQRKDKYPKISRTGGICKFRPIDQFTK